MDISDNKVGGALPAIQSARGSGKLLAVLLDNRLPEDGRIRTIAQLLAAEERLDELESTEEGGCPECDQLRRAVMAFVSSSPELLDAPWLRCAGAVHDMLQRLREPRMRG